MREFFRLFCTDLRSRPTELILELMVVVLVCLTVAVAVIKLLDQVASTYS